MSQLGRRLLLPGQVAMSPLLQRRSVVLEATLWAIGDARGTSCTLPVLLRQVAHSQQQHAEAAVGGNTRSSAHLTFDDHQAIFKGQSTASLLRGLLVFTACSIPGFVEASPTLLRLSRQFLGERITTDIIRRTFFAQFCGGEDEASLQGKVRELRQRGVGSILDYAAEDDVPMPAGSIPAAPTPITAPSPTTTTATVVASPSAPAGAPNIVVDPSATPAPSTAASSTGAAATSNVGAWPEATPEQQLPQEGEQVVVVSAPPGAAVARQYCYLSEAKCDGHVDTFLSSIASAGRMPGQGFAAVKLTALGNPLLLKRVSTAIREVQGLFAQWDTDGNQVVDRSEFESAYKLMLPDATPDEQRRVFEWMDLQRGGRVDYVAWTQRMSLTKMPELAARIAASTAAPASPAAGAWRASLQGAALNSEEVQLVTAMRARLRRLASAAADAQVKLMMDAEHTYFQPAIDHLTLELSRKYNAGPAGAIIYNTYQAYLKDTPARLVVDLERARREGYVLGAKLVRGAYMEIERARAERLGQESPVHETLEDTHRSYDHCAQVLLQAVKEKRAEVLFGTHNQRSIEMVVQQMSELGLDPVNSKVYFGQLLGMSDHLTQVLGTHGFQAYKYVPYGAIHLVVPYLLRRAVENASIMKGSKRDVNLLRSELWRRTKAAVGLK